MAAMDENKRKFLKHLGLLGFGALIGLGISQVTSITETDLINNLSNAEIKSGRKRIWKDLKEYKRELDPADNYPLREGDGRPKVRESVCAYHIDEDYDGEYESDEEGKYCSMPCNAVCPVKRDGKKAIEPRRITDGTNKGKITPEVDNDKCIGCTKCFRICGYYAIEWINYP
jgi:NAD-dependent dihydropyrimidine dehydrogenase PreA subunit